MDMCEYASNVVSCSGVGAYGGKEGVVGDVCKQRATTGTAAGGELLGQLVLWRVGFHGL